MDIEQTYKAVSTSPRILAVKANGGTVTISKPIYDNDGPAGGNVLYWVAGDTFNADGCYPLYTGGDVYKLTPSGGAEYEVS